MRKRKLLRWCLAGGVLLLLASGAPAQQTISLPRQDQRVVAITTYQPKSTTCRGLAIISPGAGGSEQGYGYLGEALSSLGYFSVVVGHQESGRDAVRERARNKGLRDGLADLITDPGAYRGRFMDIAATRQWAQGRCRSAEVVLVGHSMGAATAMLEAGAGNTLGLSGTDSFTAYIALSPQGPGSLFLQNAWSEIRKPVLLVTGTEDTELGGASWQSRTEPFANMSPGCKWLGVIDGANHMNFAGHGRSQRTEALTTQIVGDFLDALQRGDCRVPRQLTGMTIQSK